MGYLGRDVEVTRIDSDLCLVTACDSCGAAGEKELDYVKVPNQLVGRLTTRVALLEVVAAGANPRITTVAVSAEPNPAGAAILEGVQEELQFSGLKNITLSISTEKNIPTRQTGLGIGITGVCLEKRLRLGLTRPGDYVYCLGQPKVGSEVTSADDPEIVNVSHITSLQKETDIHDIIPVGSQGILGEINQLAQTMKLIFESHEQPVIDLKKSAGPATCLIFTCSEKREGSEFQSLLLSGIGNFKADQA